MGFLLMVLVVLAAVVVLRVGALVTDRLGPGGTPPTAGPGPEHSAGPASVPGGYTLLDPTGGVPGAAPAPGQALPAEVVAHVHGLLAQDRANEAVAAVRDATGLPPDQASALVARIRDGGSG
ncbi:hypothetical protein ACFOVU_08970 [Nocardiopsis sediminis]|uniref:Ribosomal protein L7/L12 C-terminal domain-containing protein n=1 Tax=Nocardiopsis sediminis TaxID=1778267 RepID=A0ABV8FM43_9ACTN